MMKKLLLFLNILVFGIFSANAQCINTSYYPTTNVAANEGTVTQINTCIWDGDYSQIPSVVAGETYEFTSSTGSYITVYQDGVSTTFLGNGASPYSVTAITGGDLYVHWNTDAACATATTCIVGTVQWTSWTPPACPAPTAQTVSNITATTATLDWVTGGVANWIVEYGPAGFTQGSGMITAVSAFDSLNIMGLSPSTTYDWYVRDFCAVGDSSFWLGANSFTTACVAFTPDYSEDFTTFPANCWEEADAGDFGTGPTTLGSSPWASSTNLITNTVRINLYTTTRSDWMLSPEFDLSGGSYEVVLDVAVTDFFGSTPDLMGSDDRVMLAYTEDGVTWNLIKAWTASDALSNNLVTYSFPLVSTASNVQFGILATDGPVDDLEDYDFHFTNFIVRTPPACAAPSMQTVSNITTTTATLDWVTGGVTDWIVEYGPAGFTQGSGTVELVSTDDSLNISGLSANTSYDWYVRDFCGVADSSAWIGANTFYTGHCIPTPSSVDYNGITNVTMGTINNTTVGEVGNYADYSAMITDASQTTTLNIDITIEYGYGLWAWIDWNDDLDFEDVGEFVFLGESPAVFGTPGVLNSSIVIPASASLGNHRIRIGGSDTQHGEFSIHDPCYTGTYGSFEDYTLNVTAPPACIAPSALIVSNITDTSATLDWVAGSATDWIVEYGPAGFTQGDGIITLVSTDDSLNVMGLMSSTSYDWYVRDFCGIADSSAWSAVSSFATLCPSIFTAPFCDGFEGNACWENELVTDEFDWTINSGATISGGTGPTAANTGSFYAYTETSTPVLNGWTAVVYSPLVDLTALTNPSVDFYYHMFGVGMDPDGTVLLDVSNDNGATWTNVFTEVGNQGDQWNNGYVTLPSFVGDSVIFRFTGLVSSTGTAYENDFAIDDFCVAEALSCAAPSSQTVSDIAATTVTLDWVTGSATDWVVEYGVAGFTQGAGMVASVTAFDSLNITGLMSATDYEWYVRDYCGGTDSSTWVGPNSFTTLCAVFTPDYSEDFATFPANCWDVADAGSLLTGPTTPGTSIWQSGLNVLSSNTARINLYNTAHSDWMLSPEFDLSVGGYEVVIDVAVTNWNSAAVDVMGSDDSITLAYTEDGITWTAINSWTAADALANNLTTFSFPLASMGANVQFGILATDGLVDDAEDYDFHFSNFIVRTPPSCTQPSTLMVSNLLATTATLDWVTGSATDWVVEYGVAGFTQGAGMVASVTADDSLNIMGLMSATDYEWYVRDYCGGTDSSAWVGPNSFSTPCAVFTPDYSEDFATFPAVCWDVADAGSLLTGPTTPGSSIWQSGLNVLSSNTARINLYNTAHSDWMLSPEFDLSVGGYEVVIDVAVTNWNSAAVDAMGSDDSITLAFTEDGINWTAINSWTAADALANSLTTFSFPLASMGANVQFGILATDGLVDDAEDYDFHFSNFIVRTPPVCNEPTALMVSNLTANTATLDWVTGSSTDWVVEYGAAGFTQGAGIVSSVTGDDSLNIIGLMSNTDYEWYVRDYCGATDSSTWAGPISFTTLISCPAPTALMSNVISFTEVDLLWATGSSSDWIVEYGVAGFAQGAGTVELVSTDDSLNLTGLMANTTYDWYVRDYCSMGDSSVWVASQFFTGYCIPGGGSQDANGITNVTMGTINNTSGQEVDSYTDFSAMSTDASQTSTLNIDVTLESGFSYQMYAWVDWNNDLDFTDAGEEFYLGESLQQALTTLSSSITIPASASLGNHVIRIGGTDSSWDFAPADPCYTGNWAAFEDYTLNVVGPPSCIAPTMQIVSNLTATTATLDWVAGSATDWVVEYGLAGFTQGAGMIASVTGDDSLNIMGLMSATDYEWYVRDYCGGTDSSAWAGPNSFYTGYCTPGGGFQDPNGITNVTMGSINNTTGQEVDSYGDYSAMIADVGQGGTFDIDVTLGTSYSYDMWAWVDWNNDLDFTDAGEEFYLGASIALDPTTFSGSITIPASASLGNHIIRIGGSDVDFGTLGSTSPSNPCYTDNYGAFEDYTLNVIACNIPVTMVSTPLCDGDSLVLSNGMVVKTPGMVNDTLAGNAGCDSVLTYDVTILMPTTSTDVAVICQGSPLTLAGGTEVTMAGTYEEVFVNSVGCDSTVTTTVTVNVATASSVDVHLCDGDTYVLPLSGLEVSAANSYLETTMNAAGCDSVITYNVSTGMATTSTVDASYCTGGGLMLADGTGVTTPGMHTATILNASGCDSVITYNVTENQTAMSSITESICEGESFMFDGQALTVANDYFMVVSGGAANGCDSLVNLTLVVNVATSSMMTAEICEGETYMFDGQSLTDADTYTQTLTNANGCDSVVTLTLTVNVATSSMMTAEICEGETYMFDGQSLTGADTYTQTLTNANGCDSVVTLVLTVNVATSSMMTASICEGETYMFDGQALTDADTYTQTLTNVNGCDSVVTLVLTVNVATSSMMTASICEGETYMFDGQSLTDADTYTQTLTNANGCDSVVTLVLTVNVATSSMMEATICDGDSYMFDGQALTDADTYTQTLTNAAGCDSVVTLTLIVNALPDETMTASLCKGSEYIFGTQTLYDAGVYTETFTNELGCEYDVTLTLSINNSVSTSEEVLLCGDVLEFILANGTVVDVAGIYTVNLAAANGCDSTVTYNVTTCVGIFDLDNNVAMTVYPNPTKDVLNVDFANKLTAVNNITVVNVLGQDVYSINNLDERTLTINTSSFTSGIYYLHVTSDNKVSVKSFTVAK